LTGDGEAIAKKLKEINAFLTEMFKRKTGAARKDKKQDEP
jgi:hypothetical protein